MTQWHPFDWFVPPLQHEKDPPLRKSLGAERCVAALMESKTPLAAPPEAANVEAAVAAVAHLCDDAKLHAAKAGVLKQRLVSLKEALPAAKDLQQHAPALQDCLHHARDLLEPFKNPGNQFWKLALDQDVKDRFEAIDQEFGG